jgi:transposase
MAYHRAVPEGGKIKKLTINGKAGRYFAVLSVEVPESAWQIVPMQAGWHAGIDPGASTALTVALKNSKTGELAQFAAHWEFLEKSQAKLEELNQALARKRGPMRERTEEEIQKAMKEFSAKAAIKKLPSDERSKEIAKKEKWLRSTKVRNTDGMSNRWRQGSRRVAKLNMRVANQRADVHHKISRVLAEGCDIVGVGDWEPPREVSYKKAIKAAKKKVKRGAAGAAEDLKKLEEEKSKQGPKGIKKVRRGGRDRGIATLRRLLVEKAGRAGIIAIPKVNEKYSTMTCYVCHEQTGPQGNLSIREWKCEKCNTLHHRDLNSGFNILRKAEENTAAQAVPETGTAARTGSQGCDAQTGRGDSSSLRATGTSGSSDGFQEREFLQARGGSFFYGHAGGVALPNLWNEEVPKALKSLIQMGIVRPLTMQNPSETGSGTPP